MRFSLARLRLLCHSRLAAERRPAEAAGRRSSCRGLAWGAALGASLTTPLLPGAALAGVPSLSKLFVFGDSLSDSGNAGVLTGGTFTPLPYIGNRASNGPVAVEYLWQNFNPGDNTFLPSRSGGTNYAVLGATTGTENNVAASNPIGSPLNLAFDNQGNALQLNTFKTNTPTFNPNTSLFLVWLFPNDVFYFRSTSSNPNIPGATGNTVGTYSGTDGTVGGATYNTIAPLAVNNVLGTINELATAGARNFLVVNSPDLGNTPAFLSTPLQPLMSSLSTSFNNSLESEINSLISSNPQLDIELFQLDDFFNSIIANPASYGLSNVNQACLANTTPCSNPSSYLFWDQLHPTTQAHSLIGEALYNQAFDPVPGPLPALGGLAALGWSRRLRQRRPSLTSQPGNRPSTTRY
jgi:phospholipase/lecithinase/hemolysin